MQLITGIHYHLIKVIKKITGRYRIDYFSRLFICLHIFDGYHRVAVSRSVAETKFI